MTAPTRMAAEIAEIPEAAARQLREAGPLHREIGARLRRDGVGLALTCARGSSDHAAIFFKYLAELRLGVPVASVGPSVASVYGAPLRVRGALALAISQSGASPDLAALQSRLRADGAWTVALLNETGSPVGAASEAVVPLAAGPEHSVAATKSHVASLLAAAAIVAAWSEDAALADALEAMPETLARAVAAEWSAAGAPLAVARPVFAIGRGPGLATAFEAALKLKETCGLHSEGLSAAELRHGPIALADANAAALVFASRDAARPSLRAAVAALRAAGARVFVADFAPGEGVLPAVAGPHPLLDPVCQIAAFYPLAERLARALGRDPDTPAHLAKVTETT